MAQSFLFLLEHIRKYVQKGSGIHRIGNEKAKTKYMDSFISDIKTRPLVLKEWNDDVWCYLVVKAIMYRDASIKFLFRNGKEIAVK